MSITLDCPSCGRQVRGRDEFAGKRVKCRYCKAAFHFPNPEDADQESDPAETMSESNEGLLTTPPVESPDFAQFVQRLRLDHVLATVSVAWLLLLVAIPGGTPAAVWVTFGLLAVDAVVGVWVLLRHKRIAVLLNLAQLALFCAVHPQVYSAWGTHHYAVDRPPQVIDWVGFTAAHVLRAADLLDFIEEYGLDIQHVKHASTLSGSVLVAMHLTVDIFLLGLLVRWAKKVWQRVRRRWTNESATELSQHKERAERIAKGLEVGKAVCLAACVVLYIRCADIQGWTRTDWLLWPLDAILRVVDVADAMQIYHWRLHNVAPSVWLSTLAVLLRLFVGLYLAEWITYVTLAWFKGATRTIEELIEDLSNRNPAVRKLAAERLGAAGPQAEPAVPVLIAALADNDESVYRAIANALGQIGPAAVRALIAALADNDGGVRAATALGQIGPAAEPAVPTLVNALATGRPAVAGAAVTALGQIGPAAAPAIPALFAVLTAVRARGYATIPAQPEDVRKAVDDALRQIAPAAAPAVPVLIKALATTGDWYSDVRSCAATALGQIGPAAEPAVSALTNALADNYGYVQRAAAKALGQIGTAAQPAVPALTKALADCDVSVRQAAADALEQIGHAARCSVPNFAERPRTKVGKSGKQQSQH